MVFRSNLGLAEKAGAYDSSRRDTTTRKGTRYSLDCFSTSSDYFDPSHAPFMVNYIVDDLDACSTA